MGILGRFFGGPPKPRQAQPRQTLSPTKVAEHLIEVVRTWPAKYGDSVKQDFADIRTKDIDEVFDEIQYFLAFSTEFGLHLLLKDRPKIQAALRDAFAKELRNFAVQNHCKPIPRGEWMSGRIWIPGEIPDKMGDPIVNLNDRFALYTEVLQRGTEKLPYGASLAYVLASLCGNMDLAFIAYASELFFGPIEEIKNVIASFDITA